MNPFARRGLPAALCAMLALAACDARADHANAGRFDGKWEFDMTFSGDAMCAFEGLPLVTRMRDGHAHGLYTEPNYGGWTYTAVAQDDGVFVMTLSGYAIVRLTGTLSAAGGTGDIDVSGTSLYCDGEWSARKLPEATRLLAGY